MVGLVSKDSLEKRTFQYCTLCSIINLQGSHTYMIWKNSLKIWHKYSWDKKYMDWDTYFHRTWWELHPNITLENRIKRKHLRFGAKFRLGGAQIKPERIFKPK